MGLLRQQGCARWPIDLSRAAHKFLQLVLEQHFYVACPHSQATFAHVTAAQWAQTLALHTLLHGCTNFGILTLASISASGQDQVRHLRCDTSGDDCHMNVQQHPNQSKRQLT